MLDPNLLDAAMSNIMDLFLKFAMTMGSTTKSEEVCDLFQAIVAEVEAIDYGF